MGPSHKVLLRSDGEAAIVDLLNRVGDMRSAETLLEGSPAGDSRANGLAERAIQSVEKQIRVLKLALERNVGAKVGVEHPCFPWLAEHAADILTKFVIGRDGMTAWERLKGRKYSGVLFEFGANILLKVQLRPMGGEMAARWLPGVWLGKRFATDEHVVAMEDGTVVRADAVREFPGQRFDKDLLDKIIGAPWDLRGTGSEQGGGEREDPRAGDVRQALVIEPTPMTLPVARRLMITKDILDKVEYTDGCRKCRDILEGDRSRPGLSHSEECRARVIARMQADPELRPRLQCEKERQDAYLEARLEAEFGKRKPQPARPAEPGSTRPEAPAAETATTSAEPEAPQRRRAGSESE